MLSVLFLVVHERLRQLSRSLTTERERLKCALEQEAVLFTQNNSLVIASLKQSLAEVYKLCLIRCLYLSLCVCVGGGEAREIGL